MRYYQKHSFFPVVIILLTLLLGGFMFFVLRGSFTQEQSTIQEPKLVNEDDYRDGVSGILQSFEEQFAVSQDNAQKRLATQSALNALLELRVPVEYKDLHLQLAITWNQIQTVLQDNSENELDASFKTIEQLKITYPWLTQ